MPLIPIINVGERPFVSGSLILNGKVGSRPIAFVIDTAADSSLVSPFDESSIRESQVTDLQFVQVRIRSLLGDAVVRALAGKVEIAFADIHAEPVLVQVPHLLFSGRSSEKPNWFWSYKKASPSVQQSILGRDVLKHFTLLIGSNYGFLATPDTWDPINGKGNNSELSREMVEYRKRCEIEEKHFNIKWQDSTMVY